MTKLSTLIGKTLIRVIQKTMVEEQIVNSPKMNEPKQTTQTPSSVPKSYLYSFVRKEVRDSWTGWEALLDDFYHVRNNVTGEERVVDKYEYNNLVRQNLIAS